MGVMVFTEKGLEGCEQQDVLVRGPGKSTL